MIKQRKYRIVIVILALAVVLGAAALAVYLAADPAAGDDVVDVHQPFGLYAPGTLDEVPTSAAQYMMETLGLSSLAAYQDYHIGLIGELGVSWVRVDFLYDGWKFNDPADYIGKLHDRGIEVVGNARPLNTGVPADLANFQTQFVHLVRRYPYIKVWQIGNEPNLSWQNPDDYPRFFQVASTIVRQECPDCKIALAGVAARFPSQDEAVATYDRILAAIAANQANPQQDDYRPPFDIFDMHYYRQAGEETAMLDSLDAYSQLLDKYHLAQGTELWVTETATNTGSPAAPPDTPPQTEEQQASELVRRFVTMLAADVTRISWARIYENYRYQDTADTYYDHAGLIYNGLGEEAQAGIQAGTRKLGFFAYKTLIAKLDGCDRQYRLAPGKFKFTFPDGRPPVFVLWDDGTSGNEPPGELSGRVRITGLGGSSSEMDASDLTLTGVPVFVEQE